jgi:asparagine synthase (glutamine-hydrolysing)
VPNPGRQLHVGVDGAGWLRFPVRTRVLGPADRFADTIGWYVAELVAAVGRDGAYRRQLDRPWYLVVAAKPLAVAQGRVRPLWELRPGWWARRISGFVRDRSWRGLGNPWTMQLAIDEVGLRRLLVAAGAAAAGRAVRRRGLFDRLAGAGAHAVSGPVEGSVYPANVAVAAAPRDPEVAADQLLEAVRAALPAEVGGALAGCGIVATDGALTRVLGVAGDRPAGFYAAVCADDPMGGRAARTPAAVVLPAPSRAPAEAQPARRRGRVAAGRR